jgi:hypothetical protein
MINLTKIVCLTSVSMLIFACSNPKTNKEPQKVVETVQKAPIVGGDQDEHGCKGSAGYTWSVAKNECIRLFELGIRLNAKAADLDKSVSAFVVFKSDTDDAQAEIFLPNSKGSFLLTKEKKESAGVWKNATYTLKQWKGMYMLDDAKGKALYEGSVVKK